ncbi:uncharacterized protein EV154DRAFT_496611 [Mucor mucedo]|uniref:uncharacterized protein n=1 Tax=Mucor mucedo TaxID=29922 RepID=UPI0022211EA8|nr:uncharacterized protein EV154DRAFT_496611 [Mucor mucedo]KAI7894970.1 hypothetical protein EV154DRAFT_496611 [Mucor mucedo]
MGLPLWKPRDVEQEAEQEEYIKHQEDIEDEDSWSIFSHQLVQNVYNRRPTSRHSVNTNTRHLSPSSIPVAANSPHLRRSRIARRQSMLTSSLMDRRRTSRVHPLPPTSSSPPVRSELDRRLQQRMNEKEDLLEQLQSTITLLDQLLSAGNDISTLSEDLSTVVESAASLANMAPSVLSTSLSTPQHTSSNEVSTLHGMVDRLLQMPPYSIRIHNIETNIISAHRRIREQLCLLGSTTIPLPIPRQTSPLDSRTSFFDYIETNSSISRS